jgi:hypothetical protein
MAQQESGQRDNDAPMGGKRRSRWCENKDLRKADDRAMPKPQPGSMSQAGSDD